MSLNTIGENENSFPDPREEQRINDKSDFEHECLKESARVVIENQDGLAVGRQLISHEIERYDEHVEGLLSDFPQHIIDDFKFKIGE